eukprot:9755118-Ditylum_brightwellii.AAC.1
MVHSSDHWGTGSGTPPSGTGNTIMNNKLCTNNKLKYDLHPHMEFTKTGSKEALQPDTIPAPDIAI